MANEKEKIKKLYTWGNGNQIHLHGVESTILKRKNSQWKWINKNVTSTLSTADFNLPSNLHKLNGKNKLDAAGLKTLRGINGSLQW